MNLEIKFKKELFDSIENKRSFSYVRRYYEKYMYQAFVMNYDLSSPEIQTVKQKYNSYIGKLEK